MIHDPSTSKVSRRRVDGGDGDALIALLDRCRHDAAARATEVVGIECVFEAGYDGGVTLQLLWQEYRDRHPDGYSYSQFRRHYRAHQRLSGEPRMRRTPAPVAMCEVDYAGQTMVVATLGGERRASVFVGSLPFSAPARHGFAVPSATRRETVRNSV